MQLNFEKIIYTRSTWNTRNNNNFSKITSGIFLNAVYQIILITKILSFKSYSLTNFIEFVFIPLKVISTRIITFIFSLLVFGSGSAPDKFFFYLDNGYLNATTKFIRWNQFRRLNFLQRNLFTGCFIYLRYRIWGLLSITGHSEIRPHGMLQWGGVGHCRSPNCLAIGKLRLRTLGRSFFEDLNSASRTDIKNLHRFFSGLRWLKIVALSPVSFVWSV